jgi:hypothetical protein
MRVRDLLSKVTLWAVIIPVTIDSLSNPCFTITAVLYALVTQGVPKTP